MKQRIGRLKVGDGLEQGSEMGPLINQAHRDRVAGYVDKGVAEGAAVRAAERTPSPPSPTIHVTIGRVEVRAAPRPDAPRRAPAPPPMGLEEYLARRAAARRP